jgi:hypothetical protein
MSHKILGSNIILCESIIEGKDNVFSAVRIVDLHTLPPTPVGIPAESIGVDVHALVQLKGNIGDEEQYEILVQLFRPDGERLDLFKRSTAITSTIEDTPGGLNLNLKIGVAARQMGTHYIVLTVDGVEINRSNFTLRGGGEQGRS